MYKIYTSLNASSNFCDPKLQVCRNYLSISFNNYNSFPISPASQGHRYNLGKQYRETVTKISDLIQYKTGH